MAAWADEITLVSMKEGEERVNDNGFPNQEAEVKRVIFCNVKTTGYNEYFKSQQTGKVVEKKCDVHKADYEGEDTVELEGKRYYVLKTYEPEGDEDVIELSLTDIRHKDKGA
ncbi:MAG: hypothetical protein OSJ69_06360 [Acetatifactor sp.]|nr:hypothetical protein [Acetatifactor sp.]